MSAADVRSELESAWLQIDARALASKDSPRATFDLARLFASINPADRPVADHVLADWALSDDERKRFDALALIQDFEVTSALPALRVLASRLEASDGPSAPYDWAKVNGIIGTLTGADRRP